MAKVAWRVATYPAEANVTSFVLNFTVSWGRQNFISPYQGRTATITIKNDNEQADFFPVNEMIYIRSSSGYYAFFGVVLTRDFIDAPGNGAGSTCVVTLVDAFALAGTQQTTVDLSGEKNQLEKLAETVTNPNVSPFGSWYFVGSTDTAFTTGSFTGNVQSQMQQTILADRGILIFNGLALNFYYPPSDFDLLIHVPVGNVTFGRDATSTQIAYEVIDRAEAASEATWFNNATITGSLTAATKSNGSTAQYGVKSFTMSSSQSENVNSTAEWFANNFISPNRLNLNLTFSDISQNETALNIFLEKHVDNGGYFSDVYWTTPGGSSTSQTFWPEQYSISATPEQTRFSVAMTNINTYQNFTLNSTTFGVLDTSRLGVGPIS